MTSDTRAEVLRGIRIALPLVAGFLPLAFILGAQGAEAGAGAVTMALMSGLNYAGGSEFAALALWSAAPPFATVVFATWLINSRHIVLGATLAPKMPADMKLSTRLLVFFLMCDEAWALAMKDVADRERAGAGPETRFSTPFYLGMALSIWIFWWTGAAAGAALAGGLGDLSALGFGLALPATFIALSVMMWPGKKRCAAPVAAACAAALASLFLPSHLTVLAGTVTGLVVAYVDFLLRREG